MRGTPPSSVLTAISLWLENTKPLGLHSMAQDSIRQVDRMDEVEKKIREQIIQDIESVRRRADDEFTRGLNTGLNWAIDVINGNF